MVISSLADTPLPHVLYVVICCRMHLLPGFVVGASDTLGEKQIGKRSPATPPGPIWKYSLPSLARCSFLGSLHLSQLASVRNRHGCPPNSLVHHSWVGEARYAAVLSEEQHAMEAPHVGYRQFPFCVLEEWKPDHHHFFVDETNQSFKVVIL